MRISEIIDTAEQAQPLPGRVQQLLAKPHKARLKDGRVAIITTEWAKQHSNALVLTPTVDGEHAGSMLIGPNRVPPSDDDDYDVYADDRGSWSVWNIWINQDFTRLGIATAMYDLLTRAGMKILASGRGYGGKLTPPGQSLWQSNQPRLRLGKPRPKSSRFWVARPKKITR